MPPKVPTNLQPRDRSRVAPSHHLDIKYRAVTDLRLNERNPRAHSPRQIRQIARSIATFGFNVPVLIDPDDRVVAGHGRVLACRQLGWTEVPTIRLDHLGPAQMQAFMVADNRLAEISTWDERLLAETLRELTLADLDFELEVIGFEMAEIDLRIEGLDAPPKEAPDPADVLAERPAGPAVSKSGDLWLLGRHRLLCGSALEQASYATLLPAKRAAMVFTDPPYNVRIAGHVSGLGVISHREFPMASGEMSGAEFTAFLTTALGLAAQHSRAGSLHFVCMDWRHIPELLAAGHEAYSELKNLCVWAKDNAGMGSLYRSQHELVFVFKSGKAPHRNNVELGQHGRHRSNLWSYPGVNSFGRRSEEGDLLAMHPTVKPVRLVADAILDCTARGELVLDPFLGSGTTLMAAERTGRRCCGFELDPLYVDTIVRRWQELTGDFVRHAVTGCAFNDMQGRTQEALTLVQPEAGNGK
ncbi:site-specific DNA-methyltransferase [Falsiroseomonas sp. HC035]|uniref:site-specific DNA-methyltransferase n=1 Tax=Falsiroseomonas sp. HC035 TaxID=3390999 RepID=UPI003D322E4E